MNEDARTTGGRPSVDNHLSVFVLQLPPLNTQSTESSPKDAVYQSYHSWLASDEYRRDTRRMGSPATKRYILQRSVTASTRAHVSTSRQNPSLAPAANCPYRVRIICSNERNRSTSGDQVAKNHVSHSPSAPVTRGFRR